MDIGARWQQGARKGSALISSLKQDQLVLETTTPMQLGASAFLHVRGPNGEAVGLRAFVLGAKPLGPSSQRVRLSFELHDPSQVSTLRRLARTSRAAPAREPAASARTEVAVPIPPAPSAPAPTPPVDATWLGRLRARMGRTTAPSDLLKRRIGAAV